MTPARKTGGKTVAKYFQVDLPHRAFRRQSRPASLPPEQPARNELVARMRRFELFAKLPPPALAELVLVSSVRTFHAGEYLWRRGEPAQRMVFLETGFVKAARRNREGASRTYALFGPGDSLGVFAIWAGMEYPTDAVALNEGLTAICVESGAIAKLAEKYPPLAVRLRSELIRFTDAFINKIEIVSAGTVPQRVAVLMMHLTERYGTAKEGVQAQLPVALTLEQISEIVGARLETVARVLGSWRRAGWLAIDTRGYRFIRLDKIRELLPQWR